MTDRPPPEFLEKMWHLLVGHGGAIPQDDRWRPDVMDYYSGNLTVGLEKSQEAYDDLLKSGIDYGKCSDIQDGHGSEFNGTFVEATTVPYLIGTLVSGSGKSYLWGVLSQPMDIKMVFKVMSMQIDFDTAMASLKQRLDSADGEWSFRYHCRIFDNDF
jgi:hypothetical protein